MAEWQVYVIRSSGPLLLRLPNQLCSMPPIQPYSVSPPTTLPAWVMTTTLLV